MIRISNIKYPIELAEENLPQFTEKKYKTGKIKDFRIVKQSIDARKKNDIHYVYTIDIAVDNESKLLKRLKNASIAENKIYIPVGGRVPEKPVVIAGFGPAGIMCAHTLVSNGCPVIVLERGCDADTRIRDVDRLRNEGVLNPESNVQFGEGGAGTFSDGKLTTGVNDKRIAYVLNQFVKHGAPHEIEFRAKPHIGTDNLVEMVKSFRKDIEERGGEIRFSSRLEDIITSGGRIKGVRIASPDGEYEIETDNLVIATGHSARDTFKMLKNAGASMERKVFAVGARIEHIQDAIGRAQYGEMYSILPAADYKLSV